MSDPIKPPTLDSQTPRGAGRMSRANRMGILSVVLVGVSMLPPYENWKQPVNAVLLIAAFALAFFAGEKGSRWWWCVCGLLIAMLAGLLFFAWTSLP